MCYKEENKIARRKEMNGRLESIILEQFETEELWEIDDCIKLLFDLSHGKNVSL